MKVQFFSDTVPQDPEALHIWLGKSPVPHDQLILNLSGQTPPLSKTQTGKPYFPNSPLHFNLSDSEDWIAVAFSWRHAVGIDLEVVRPIEGMKSLISDCFSPRERAYVEETDTLPRFWEIWNRKEACLKALGLGLQDRMEEWDCFGQDWVYVKGVRVCSLSIQKDLSMAIAYHE